MKVLCLFILLVVTSFYTSDLYSLEVDEKLTLKIIRSSSTKKTILVNRGLEDGLAEGDHAKFYLTTGVVARGIVVKVSPSRSVWSVYALIRPDEIVAERVLNLKISTPVKLTQDKTKMLTMDNNPENSLVPLSAEAYDDPNRELSEEEQNELKSMQEDVGIDMVGGLLTNKDLEIWGLFHFNGLSTASDLGENGSVNGSISSLDFSFGLEKYFSDSKSWLNKTSIFAVVANSSKTVSVLEGSQSELNSLEFGLGINYHFLAPANSFSKLILYGTTSFGIGSSEEVFTLTSIGSTAASQPYSGSTNFFSMGVGIKYFTIKGFGLRALFDYYRRGENYVISNSSSDFSKVISGPRFQFGLAYRW